MNGKQNYLGGPALRCGGDATRSRFGEDCPATAKAAVPSIEGLELKEAEVAEITVEATVPSFEGLELQKCWTKAGT